MFNRSLLISIAGNCACIIKLCTHGICDIHISTRYGFFFTYSCIVLSASIGNRNFAYTLCINLKRSILIILIVKAVKLGSYLSCNNGDTNTVDRKSLILVAGRFIHVTLNNNAFCFGIRCKGNFSIDVNTCAIGKADNLKQLCITNDTVDNDTVLESKVAFVYNAKLGKLICTSRLPKDFCCTVCFYPTESLTLGRNPTIALFHFKRDIQFTCLDLVYRCTCGVGEPRKGRANQHSYAEKHSHDADYQCVFG